MLGRTRVSEPNSPARAEARGQPGCAPKLSWAVDQAIEAARQRRTMQATRIALGPNRVLGRYVDTALAWGVIGRSNDIAHPDVIEHLFAFPLQAAGVAQQGGRHVFEDVNAIDGAEVAAVKSIKIFPARFVDDIAVNDGLLV